jgi:hypothetical protein
MNQPIMIEVRKADLSDSWRIDYKGERRNFLGFLNIPEFELSAGCVSEHIYKI